MNESHTLSVYEKKAKIKWRLNVKKTGKNKYNQSNYFSLEDIVPALHELCKKYNCDVDTNFPPGRVVGTFIDLDSGDVLETEIQMPEYKLETGKNSLAQVAGSNVTYFRRYLLLTMFDIVETDFLEEGLSDSKNPQDSNSGEIPEDVSKILEKIFKWMEKEGIEKPRKREIISSMKSMQKEGSLLYAERKKVSKYLYNFAPSQEIRL